MAETRKVEIDAGEHGEFAFDVSQEDYNKFVLEIQQNGINIAANNLLLNTLASGNRTALREAMKRNWGLANQLAKEITEQISPTVGMTVKKPKPSQDS